MAETFGQRFDQHTDDIIEATELLKELSDREGQYVWEKFTAQNGDSLGYVVSDDETAYPDGGIQDGYWYERVSEGVSGIDYGEVTASSALSTLTINHTLGRVPTLLFLVAKSVSGITTAARTVVYASTNGEYPMNINGTAYYTLIGASSSGGGNGYKGTKTHSGTANTVTTTDLRNFTSGTYFWIAVCL